LASAFCVILYEHVQKKPNEPLVFVANFPGNRPTDRLVQRFYTRLRNFRVIKRGPLPPPPGDFLLVHRESEIDFRHNWSYSFVPGFFDNYLFEFQKRFKFFRFDACTSAYEFFAGKTPPRVSLYTTTLNTGPHFIAKACVHTSHTGWCR